MLVSSVNIMADESLAWRKADGHIIGHSSSQIDIDGTTLICGAQKWEKVNWDTVAVGTVAVWVDGASNTNQLGAITEISSTTQEADYNKWSIREKAMLKLLVKEINILRGLHGLPDRTPAQVKAAIKAEIED